MCRARLGAEDAGGDPQPGGGGLVAGVVLCDSDLAADRPELGGDGRLVGGEPVEAVEDRVMLGAPGASTETMCSTPPPRM